MYVCMYIYIYIYIYVYTGRRAAQWCKSEGRGESNVSIKSGSNRIKTNTTKPSKTESSSHGVVMAIAIGLSERWEDPRDPEGPLKKRLGQHHVKGRNVINNDRKQQLIHNI